MATRLLHHNCYDVAMPGAAQWGVVRTDPCKLCCQVRSALVRATRSVLAQPEATGKVCLATRDMRSQRDWPTQTEFRQEMNSPSKHKHVDTGHRDKNATAPTTARQNKEVSHQRKRIDVLEATWRSILRVGLEQVTIREIASELKASTGTVVHYFRTKDEILVYALDHLISGMVAEIEKRLEGVTGLARLEQILFASLPLDEAGELGWRIWLAFLKTSVGSTELSAEHARRYAYMRKSLIDEISALQKQKLIRSRIDATLEADALIALTDGIGVGRIIDPTRFAPRQQRLLVERHISAFLAPQKP